MPDSVLITGASGFIGSEIARLALAQGRRVIAGTRSPGQFAAAGIEVRKMPLPSASERDWADFLAGACHVIHCAGAAHGNLPGQSRSLLAANEALSANLARAAANHVSGRFVLISSIRAAAPPSLAPVHLQEGMAAAPGDAYGCSKLLGETGVARAYGSDPRHVILRLPPVYGPGMKGSLHALMQLADTPLPLPFASLDGLNALVSVDGAARAALHVLEAGQVQGRIFYLADREPVTFSAVVRAFRDGFGRPARLFPVAPPLLGAALGLVGQRQAWLRLGGSVTVDNLPLQDSGWHAPGNTIEALSALAHDWRQFASDKGS